MLAKLSIYAFILFLQYIKGKIFLFFFLENDSELTYHHVYHS